MQAADLLEQGMRQSKAAEVLGVTPQAVSLWRRAWVEGGREALSLFRLATDQVTAGWRNAGEALRLTAAATCQTGAVTTGNRPRTAITAAMIAARASAKGDPAGSGSTREGSSANATSCPVNTAAIRPARSVLPHSSPNRGYAGAGYCEARAQ
jgi:hypothetical protein